MERYIPFEKLQKKKQRELQAKQRGSWGGLNPVTRKPANSKAYNRKKAGQWRKESSIDLPFLFFQRKCSSPAVCAKWYFTMPRSMVA